MQRRASPRLPPPGMLDIGWALSAPGVTAILHAPMLGMTSGTAVAGAAPLPPLPYLP